MFIDNTSMTSGESNDKVAPLAEATQSYEKDISATINENKTDTAGQIISVLNSLRPEEAADALADTPQIGSILHPLPENNLNEAAIIEEITKLYGQLSSEGQKKLLATISSQVRNKTVAIVENPASPDSQVKASKKRDSKKPKVQNETAAIAKNPTSTHSQTKVSEKRYPEIIPSEQLIRQGDTYYQQGQYQKALEYYHQVRVGGLVSSEVSENPNYIDTLKKLQLFAELAETYYFQEKYEEALPYFELVPAMDREGGYYVSCLENLKLYDRVVEYYKNELATNPNEPQITWRAMAFLLIRAGRNQEALEAFNASVDIAPDYWETRYSRAEFLDSIGSHEEAIQDYKHLLTLDPNQMGIRLSIAESLKKINKFEEVVALYDEILEQNPEEFYVLQIAESFGNMGNHQRAAEAYEKILHGRISKEQVKSRVINYTDDMLWNNMGYHLSKINLFEKALTAFDRASAIAPVEIIYSSNKVIMLVKLNRPDQALILLRQSLETSSDKKIDWRHMGELYSDIFISSLQPGQNENTEEVWDESIRLFQEQNSPKWSQIVFDYLVNELKNQHIPLVVELVKRSRPLLSQITVLVEQKGQESTQLSENQELFIALLRQNTSRTRKKEKKLE